ncbi:glycosyltransferase [Nannocystaceae bacterium ST9]
MTPLSLCLITKYPPIQGGVSQQNYWLAHNLARAGHHVHVVTNADEAPLDWRMFVPAAERARLSGDYPSGGSVRVHSTSEAGQVDGYIPYANPFVSKLAALARDVVVEHRCALIWSAYFEPYSIAALLTSTLTGVPFTVRHAGSDLAGLAQIPARQNLYVDLLRRADLVVTSRFLFAAFQRAGVAAEQLWAAPLSTYASDGFTPEGDTLDVEALLDEVADSEHAPRHRPGRRFDPALPTFGIYGKVGAYKGMFEFVAALGELAPTREFNLLMLVGTRGRGVDKLDEAIARAGLDDRCHRLPFLPQWMVPRFIRTCSAVAFLEHRFPIAIHTPQVGFEIQACGRCLIVSEEVRAKTQRRAQLVDGENVLVVDDPSEVGQVRRALTRVLDDPGAARAIGRRGRALVESMFAAPDVAPLVARLRRVIEEKSMSLIGLQRTLGELYANPKFRAALAEAPEAALLGRELDPDERALVLAAGRRLMPQLDRFGDMLLRKRFEYFLELFGASAAWLRAHADVEPLFATFAREYDFRWREHDEDIAWFAERLREFAGEGCGPLADLVRYDLAMWRAEAADRPNTPSFDRLADMQIGEAEGLGELELGDRLTLAPDVAIERFEHPIQRLLAEPATRVEPEPTFVAFTPRRGGTPARAHVLTAPLLALLGDLGEAGSVDALIGRTAVRLGVARSGGIERVVVQALRTLGDQHVLIRAER